MKGLAESKLRWVWSVSLYNLCPNEPHSPNLALRGRLWIDIRKFSSIRCNHSRPVNLQPSLQTTPQLCICRVNINIRDYWWAILVMMGIRRRAKQFCTWTQSRFPCNSPFQHLKLKLQRPKTRAETTTTTMDRWVNRVYRQCPSKLKGLFGPRSSQISSQFLKFL